MARAVMAVRAAARIQNMRHLRLAPFLARMAADRKRAATGLSECRMSHFAAICRKPP